MTDDPRPALVGARRRLAWRRNHGAVTYPPIPALLKPQDPQPERNPR